jgi:hypothetical protein
MPASLPLMERLAAHSLHRHHHHIDESQTHGQDPSSRLAILRETLMTVPAEPEKNGAGTRHLNWKMLQVRLMSRIALPV